MNKSIEQKAKETLVYFNGKKDTAITACNMRIESPNETEEAKKIKEWLILNIA